MMIDAGVDLAQQDRARLRKLITEYSGWDESLQTDGALEQAVAGRLTARGLSSLADYWPLIQRGSGNDGEMNKLVQLLANKETSLFREMHQFDVLRDWVLPELLAARDHPLWLWSAGCATGEEAYSLAITLLEYQARFGELKAQVIGTDIDPNALEKARQGCYGERSLRLVPDDLRRHYFVFDGQTYRVTPEVARLVAFRIHNLAEDHCPPDLMNQDVIFCRNVTIYFDDNARDRLNARLADSLREGGYLFVASAETMGHNRGRLELVSAGDTFLFRKKRPAPARTKQPTVEPSSLVPSRPHHREHTEGSPQSGAGGPTVAGRGAGLDATTSLATTSLLQRAFRAFQHQDYHSALRELEQLPADQLIPHQARCLRGAILLQQERLDEAEAACQRLLAQDPWHADAHFLLGLVYRHQGQTDAAIQTFKQAIYLQPSHRDAHFFLAETYRTEGMTAEARREYENTLNTLRVVHPPKGSPVSNLSGLEDDMLRQACEVNLRKLRGHS
jgi:chemotaxis protein methyltransferase CheR